MDKRLEELTAHVLANLDLFTTAQGKTIIVRIALIQSRLNLYPNQAEMVKALVENELYRRKKGENEKE